MASLTLATLNAQVRDLAGDPANGGTGSNTFTDSQIADAVNAAIQEMCDKMEFTYVEATIAVAAPFIQYPLANASPATALDYIKIKRVNIYNSTGPVVTELLKSTETEEDLKNNNWRQLNVLPPNALPTRWVLVNGQLIQLVPYPTHSYPTGGTTFTVQVGYVQQPAILANTTDTVDARIPFPIQIWIKYLAGAWLKELAGGDLYDPKTAESWRQLAYNGMGYRGGE